VIEEDSARVRRWLAALLLRQELHEAVDFVAYDDRLKAAARAEAFAVLP
jgi:hypothetical protein